MSKYGQTQKPRVYEPKDALPGALFLLEVLEKHSAFDFGSAIPVAALEREYVKYVQPTPQKSRQKSSAPALCSAC